MTRVKICGCRNVEQALAAAEAGADFVGMVFAASRRRVELEDASEIVRALGSPLAGHEMDAPPALFRAEKLDLASWFEHGAAALERMLSLKRPLTVGVFANNDPDEINETVDECGIDLVQLSGDEPWKTCLLVNRQVVKVLHVGPLDDAAAVLARLEAGTAMAVMLDSAVSGSYGGSGVALDWRLAGEVARALPIWLAGGLTPENVPTAIRAVRPWCVDVSSGVESDGVKDPAKMRAFVQAVRSADGL